MARRVVGATLDAASVIISEKKRKLKVDYEAIFILITANAY